MAEHLTHAEWCRKLSLMGGNQLDKGHVGCKTADHCVAPTRYTVEQARASEKYADQMRARALA